ncbi:MAG: ethylbenzene dehydrogenase-related protein [bacterium]|nr:ethylbenzene dehydrogenase-related protein [bacterium]
MIKNSSHKLNNEKWPNPILLVIQFLIIAAGSFLLLTGLKLFRFNRVETERWWVALVDQLSLSGAVLMEHIEIGLFLTALTAFYFSYQLLSGEFRRLFSFTRYSWQTKSLYLILNLLLLLTCLSGSLLAAGSIPIVSHQALLSGHLLIVLLLAAAIIGHLLGVLFSSGRRLGRLFFNEVHGQKLKPLMLLLAGLIAMVVYAVPSYWKTESQTLICRAQNRSVFVDGKVSDIEWMRVDKISVPLRHGANFDKGETEISVRALRDGRTVYFLFQWEDETRSLNKHLEKNAGGWNLIESEQPGRMGESLYSEDQLAVTFHREQSGCLANCHLLPVPGIGRHYTSGDTAEFWSWHAVSSNPVSQAIDGYWSSELNDQASGVHSENRAGGGFKLNLDKQWHQPFFLPSYFYVRDWINIMTESYQPYSSALDTFAIGSRIPAVVVAPMMGDAADIQAFGRWRGSKWTVEMARHQSTGSQFDFRLIDTLYMSVALFDNAEKKHAYTIRPIRLIFE